MSFVWALRRVVGIWILGFTWALFSGSPVAAEALVAPGSVVGWGGEEWLECGMGDERWAPVDGRCLYPIGLNKKGEITLKRKGTGAWERLTVRVGEYPYSVQRLTIQDESRVDLSAENLARVRRENGRIGALWGRRGERRFRLPLGTPLADLPSGGRFGAKRIINGEPKSPHSGADYAASRGTPVLAVADGVVALAEEHFFAGNSVFLDHGDGLISMYFHLDRIDVEPGVEVVRGTSLGAVGATGRATGPHLHIGLRWRGSRIDPALLLGPVERLPRIESPSAPGQKR